MRDDRHSQAISKSANLLCEGALGNPMRRPRKKFNSSDDLLIRQQPVTGISLKRLATRLRTTPEAIRYRAKELGVSLVVGDVRGEPMDTRTFHCTGSFVDPLLKRLKDVHEE